MHVHLSMHVHPPQIHTYFRDKISSTKEAKMTYTKNYKIQMKELQRKACLYLRIISQ